MNFKDEMEDYSLNEKMFLLLGEIDPNLIEEADKFCESISKETKEDNNDSDSDSDSDSDKVISFSDKKKSLKNGSQGDDSVFLNHEEEFEENDYDSKIRKKRLFKVVAAVVGIAAIVALAFGIKAIIISQKNERVTNNPNDEKQQEQEQKNDDDKKEETENKEEESNEDEIERGLQTDDTFFASAEMLLSYAKKYYSEWNFDKISSVFVFGGNLTGSSKEWESLEGSVDYSITENEEKYKKVEFTFNMKKTGSSSLKVGKNLITAYVIDTIDGGWKILSMELGEGIKQPFSITDDKQLDYDGFEQVFYNGGIGFKDDEIKASYGIYDTCELSIDLDGDGTKDKIAYKKTIKTVDSIRVTTSELTINNAKFDIEEDTQSEDAYYSNYEGICIVDLLTNDKFKEIGKYYQAENSINDFTQFFRFDGNNVKKFGKLSSFVSIVNIDRKENTLEFIDRCECLSTCYMYNKVAITDNGFKETKDEWLKVCESDFTNVDSILGNIAVYEKNDVSSKVKVYEKGNSLLIKEIPNGYEKMDDLWIKVQLSDKSIGYIRAKLDISKSLKYSIFNGETWVDQQKIFKDLTYAG